MFIKTFLNVFLRIFIEKFFGNYNIITVYYENLNLNNVYRKWILSFGLSKGNILNSISSFESVTRQYFQF